MAKEPTEKQLIARAKFAEQARARAAERKAAKESTLPEPAPKETVADGRSADEYEQLLQRIQELESSQWRNMNRSAGTTVGPQGLVGTTEKYSTDTALYPDPTDRLAAEPRLQPLAFDFNYELKFTISNSDYTTIDGIRTREPQFTLDLIRVMLDEETGEPTNSRYTICRMVMHEDPDAALVIARDNGITVETNDEEHFLNEMRYLRLRDWLLECFYPPKPTTGNGRREVVINGRLVEVFEVNSEDSSRIPFEKFDTTKKLRV